MNNIKIRDEDLVFYGLIQGTITINLDPNYITVNFMPEGAEVELDSQNNFVTGNIILRTTDKAKELITNFMKEVSKARTNLIDQKKVVKMFAVKNLEASISPGLQKLLKANQSRDLYSKSRAFQ